MVILKVTDGHDTRKFQVTSNLTFDQLKEHLMKVFPGLAEQEKDLHLQYRDSDGDLITLSTNEEFQQVLAHIPEDGVWKLCIKASGREPSLFDRFLQPFSWHGFDQEFKAAEELFKKKMGIGMAPQEPMKVAASEAEGHTPSTAVSSDQSGGQVLERNPRWHCRTIGSWEPRTYAGTFGHETVIGPVGYHMWWGHSDDQKKEVGEDQKKKKVGDDQKEVGDDQKKEAAPKQ